MSVAVARQGWQSLIALHNLAGTPLKPTRLFTLTLLAMLAFAGNSLLCRLALKQTTIDAASFTFIRIFSGATALWLISQLRRTSLRQAGNWPSALALFTYAAAFSFAYLSLSAGTGALLLFGAVQATMICWGLRGGERLRPIQLIGLTLALSGLVTLLFPGLSAPPLVGSILMLSAGMAWGIYSLRGKGAGDPVSATAGNFLRAVPFAVVLAVSFFPWARLDRAGIAYRDRVRSDRFRSWLCDLVYRSDRPEGGQRCHRSTQRARPRRRSRNPPARRAANPAFSHCFHRSLGRHRLSRDQPATVQLWLGQVIAHPLITSSIILTRVSEPVLSIHFFENENQRTAKDAVGIPAIVFDRLGVPKTFLRLFVEDRAEFFDKAGFR